MLELIRNWRSPCPYKICSLDWLRHCLGYPCLVSFVPGCPSSSLSTDYQFVSFPLLCSFSPSFLPVESLVRNHPHSFSLFLTGQCSVLICLPSKVAKNFLPCDASPPGKQQHLHASEDVMKVGAFVSGGKVAKRVDGKWLGDPGDCFVGCADLIEPIIIYLLSLDLCPGSPVSPFSFLVYHFAVRSLTR